MKLYRFLTATILFVWITNNPGFCQGTKSDLSLNLSYFNKNEKLQYLQATAKAKIEGKFQPVAGLHLQFYITDEQNSNLLGSAITNEKGIAITYIPPTAKDEWMKSETREFLAKSETTNLYDSTKATAEVTKSKIRIDTGADRKIQATLLALKNGSWVPVSGVDMVLAVKRMNADLLVDQNPTHTTDSLGLASTDYSLTDLPGDSAGNIILIARLDDNDVYGNLTSERIVPWGIPTRYIVDFDKRSLSARQGKTPLALAFIAYPIALAVWTVIIYLLFQIRKIKKLGDQTT
jgi:hypothetical protein